MLLTQRLEALIYFGDSSEMVTTRPGPHHVELPRRWLQNPWKTRAPALKVNAKCSQPQTLRASKLLLPSLSGSIPAHPTCPEADKPRQPHRPNNRPTTTPHVAHHCTRFCRIVVRVNRLGFSIAQQREDEEHLALRQQECMGRLVRAA